MDDETSARLRLPLLVTGQAQKEETHNEALALIDLAIGAAVEAVGIDVPPDAPLPGQCWIVGAAPQGAWGGQAGALAGWTGAGWCFLPPRDGMTAWDRARQLGVARVAGSWESGVVRAARVLVGGQQVIGARAAAIADPGQGEGDGAARACLAQVLAVLRAHGLIAG
ncbi:DUF2793 domain-containing protein [Sphingomonas sp. BK235]|uniref:DUF2793 domain-containing protein n=1 Tax=Sphingomonas sp. BK235 TaxID=2512131 RepID=UPI001050BC15|nr:DUF2793 domain-containing protein [Sphingomonas sp. BK235]TCP33615.1 uncharacterized protein DUF2793 [Sphingomonas sp. BK235]